MIFTATMWKAKILGIVSIILFGGVVYWLMYESITIIIYQNPTDCFILFVISIFFWFLLLSGIWLMGYCHSITVSDNYVKIKAFKRELLLDYESIKYLKITLGIC